MSIKSGQAIIKACKKLGHTVQAFDGFDKSILNQKFDFIFLALHGTFGEDGSIQKILEANEIKYNGSKSKASEDCFDKIVATKICRENKINTPYPSYQLMKEYDHVGQYPGDGIYASMDFQSFLKAEINYPIIVKPSKQGSSMGITILHNKREDFVTRRFRELITPPKPLLEDEKDYHIDAIEKAVECSLSEDEIIKIEEKYQLSFHNILFSPIDRMPQFDNAVIVEKYITGKEITVSILGDKALPIIEIKPHSNVYDYKSKYTKGKTEYVCPAQLDKSLSKEIQDAALKVHKLLGCEVYSRVDFRLDENIDGTVNNNFYFLEINTLPGMTETSLFPMAAKASGLSFEDLIDKIIKLSLEK